MKNNIQNHRYVLCWKIQFTILEDYILKIIEGKNGCSDNEIAEALYIKTEDVSYIVSDTAIKDFIQGDSSRRTLISGFTRKEFLIISKDDEYKASNKQYCNHVYYNFFKELNKLEYTSTPKELQSKKAHECYELTHQCAIPDNIKL